MKKINLIMLIGSLFVGSIAFGESEKSFDYEKNLQEREAVDQKNIQKYSERNHISLESATQKYSEKFRDEFKRNDKIRKEMMEDNMKD